MVKVIFLKTGEEKEVTRNEAHDLIDRGLAALPDVYRWLVRHRKVQASEKTETSSEKTGFYENRQIKTE